MADIGWARSRGARAEGQGLRRGGEQGARQARTRPHDFGFKPGIDLDRLNQLVDELETEEFLKRYHAE